LDLWFVLYVCIRILTLGGPKIKRDYEAAVGPVTTLFTPLFPLSFEEVAILQRKSYTSGKTFGLSH